MRPLRVDLLAEFLDPPFLHQDLDAGLVDVVAPAVAVVDAQDRVEIGEQVPRGQEFVDHVADDRRAPEPAADDDAEADLARFTQLRVQADVMHERRRPVRGRAVDRDLELARQVVEFRMEGGPLADQLAPDEGIDDLVARHAGEMVGGDVAHAVAGSLDGVHLDRGQLGEDLRHLLELRPVELQVLARREMAVAAVVFARDIRQLAQLAR